MIAAIWPDKTRFHVLSRVVILGYVIEELLFEAPCVESVLALGGSDTAKCEDREDYEQSYMRRFGGSSRAKHLKFQLTEYELDALDLNEEVALGLADGRRQTP